jgi:hypothetical protein
MCNSPRQRGTRESERGLIIITRWLIGLCNIFEIFSSARHTQCSLRECENRSLLGNFSPARPRFIIIIMKRQRKLSDILQRGNFFFSSSHASWQVSRVAINCAHKCTFARQRLNKNTLFVYVSLSLLWSFSRLFHAAAACSSVRTVERECTHTTQWMTNPRNAAAHTKPTSPQTGK